MSTLEWFKSSYSGNTGDCVEVAVEWRKSSYSGNDGNCVEIAACPHTVHVRDSKDITRSSLAFKLAAWNDFVEFVSR